MSRLALVAALSLFACGPKPDPSPIPRLPGDGDTNVAKPPAPSHDGAPDPWAGHTDLLAPPRPEPPTPVAIPEIDEFKLSNGLQVYVVKSDRLPVVSMQLAVRAGRMDEPASRLGVAEMAGDMLVKGTRRRNALAIAKAIDFVGGTIASNTTYEATLLSCNVLSRYTRTCLDLLPDIVIHPTFPESELVKVREQALAGVRQRLDDAAQLAALHVQNLLWGNDHVRGRVTSEQSISAIHREDLVAWHKAWFVPANAMLVVTGDVDTRRIKGELQRAFGAWRKGPVPPTPKYKLPGLSGSRIRLVDKPGQTQTHIRIAQFGIEHDDPRFFDTLVWNYALGGGAFSSRLMKVVRVEGGKTYGASTGFDRNADVGSFVAQTFTRNSEAVATAKLMLREIDKMAENGPNQEEVAAAIANLAGGYGLRFQSAGDVGSALIGAELHGFGREYLQNFPIAVGRVDVDSAKRAASEILTPKDYVMVMVGDAKDLEPQLRAAGWKYQKVAFTDPISPPVAAPEPPIDPKQAAAAKRIIDAALVAKGGRKRLEALKGFKMKATGTTTIQGQSVPVEIERVFIRPDKMRIDANLAQRVNVIVAIDGKKGWQKAPDKTGQKIQVVDIGAQDLAAIDFERWREPELILLKASAPDAKITVAPDEKLTDHADPSVDGKLQSVVKLRSPFGVEVVLYFDKRTKMLSRLSYRSAGVGETDDFSDYKSIKGIKIAHKRFSSGGPRTTKLELKSVVLDPPYDPKAFVKPKS